MCGMNLSLVKSKLFELNLSHFKEMVWYMVFNATFNNISVISWRSEVSYIMEVRGQLYHGGQFYWWRKPRENHRPVVSH